MDAQMAAIDRFLREVPRYQRDPHAFLRTCRYSLEDGEPLSKGQLKIVREAMQKHKRPSADVQLFD